jgi:hypothetical protein
MHVSDTKHIDTLCGQNAAYHNFKADYTFVLHSVESIFYIVWASNALLIYK